MKTQNQINLKKAGLTLFASLALTSASMFAAEASESLNVFISAQQNAIIYHAPAAADVFEVSMAVESLEAFNSEVEASILYRAPESTERSEERRVGKEC